MKKQIKVLGHISEIQGLESKNYFAQYSKKDQAVIIFRKQEGVPVSSFSINLPKKTLCKALCAFGLCVRVETKKEEKKVKTYPVNINGVVRNLTIDQVKSFEAILGVKLIKEKSVVKEEEKTPKFKTIEDLLNAKNAKPEDIVEFCKNNGIRVVGLNGKI